MIRRVLIAAIVVAALVVALAAAMLVPILTHRSAGGSGQDVPEGFVAETSATGADGRTRELRVETPDGAPAELAALQPGDELVGRGSGFDSGIGIYVAICVVPSLPDERPSPCLGGVPDAAIADATEGSAVGGESPAEAQPSVWITDDWAWRNFATQGWDDAATGSFTARLLIPEPAQGGLDCRVALCAVTTRADHTALADRVQDMQLPVAFARQPGDPPL
ncbi:MAG: hypothetical protein D3X82_12985 [Candidatus Leucobacter sulfamidivorax]|nr:hypothetical protein [Candidatus Leucobacter sulfamidivorax]